MSTSTSEAAAAMARAKWATIPPEERTEGAKKAANARWAGHKRKGPKRTQKRARKAAKSSK